MLASKLVVWALLLVDRERWALVGRSLSCFKADIQKICLVPRRDIQ